ncbi:MAG TPA: HNH endonuclease signature motif containing protein [Mycobacteriales bacterium]|nr:HNH endonuclease signature motif containing protein [Mycobacteriales bacterium]
MTWQSRSPRRARLPSNWATLRKQVLARDAHRCQIRGPRCVGTATEADHRRHGDDHSLTNLQAACSQCHRAKTAAEGNATKPRRLRVHERHPGTVGG